MLRCKLAEALYYFAFLLCAISRSISKINIEAILGISIGVVADAMQVVVVFCLVAKLFMQKYSEEQFLVLIICTIIFCIPSAITRTWIIIIGFLFVVCGQGIHLRALAKIAFAVYFLTFLLTIIAYNMGLVESVAAFRENSTVVRQSFGFAHPNSFGFMLFQICLAYSTFRFPTFKAIDLAVYLIAIVLSIQIADAQASAIATALALCMFATSELVSQRCKLRRTLLGLALIFYIAITVLTLFFMLFFSPSNGIHAAIDSLVHHRIAFGHSLNETYGLAAMGTNVPYEMRTLDQGFLIDNAFMRLCILIGVIPTAVYSIAGYFVFYEAYKQAHWSPIIIGYFLYFVYGISEHFMIDFSSNFYMLALSALLFSQPLSCYKGDKDGQ